MRVRTIGWLMLLTVSSWTAVVAQGSAGSALPRIGIVGGINLATLSGSDLEGVSNHTGLVAGVQLVLPQSNGLSFQPELLFTMKGAESSGGGVTVTTKINYLEVPLLARWDIAASGGIKPFVYAGPGLALKMSCNFEGSGQGVSISESCDSSSPGEESSVKKYDVGGIVGGGVAFDVGGRTFSVGARYELGLIKLSSDSDVKNRALSFIATFEWPFHR